MAAKKLVQQGVKQVRPVLSVDSTEARRRVLNLYKAWYRQIPYTVKSFRIPISVEQGRAKVRELFLKNKNVTDIRAIDMLVIKVGPEELLATLQNVLHLNLDNLDKQGQMDLVETANIWKQRTHVMAFFKDTVNPRPTDFMSKFYEGQD